MRDLLRNDAHMQNGLGPSVLSLRKLGSGYNDDDPVSEALGNNILSRGSDY